MIAGGTEAAANAIGVGRCPKEMTSPIGLLDHGTNIVLALLLVKVRVSWLKDFLKMKLPKRRVNMKTILGPKGMDKILQSTGGGHSVRVTNVGATILKSLHIDNPTAKVFIDISKIQDDEVGDGTMSVVVLAGELLREAENDNNFRLQIITLQIRPSMPSHLKEKNAALSDFGAQILKRFSEEEPAKGTLDYGLILFSSTTDFLIAYSDDDCAGCLTTRRSTSGYCVFLGNNLLSWSSKRQPTLSRSSAEAEYRGVANAVTETCWIRNLLRELHTPLSSATIVYCDNVSAVYLSSNPVQHQRTKHIEIDIHFVRDLVATGQVHVLHVPSRFRYADIFTKGLPSALFDEFRDSLSVSL
nr:ribonuclease H-like domain-containing protein [Tanacetum cinerariifolium]